MANNNDDQGADFSNYIKQKSQENSKLPEQKTTSPIQEVQSLIRITRRAKWLVLIFVVLILAQAALLVWNHAQEKPAIPAGYKLVTPPNQPGHIEPIK